ncbi:MAG: hypothetical protein J7K87_02885 [Candidatus Aenigmarchaeota archaeon]|nr:hypothetical protein [Candidatus Aenigmarchaeota archaeon]
MEPLYDIIVLIFIIAFGYWSVENRELFIFSSIVLSFIGLFMGAFLDDVWIYSLLFILGFITDRAYIRYKWPVTERPKTADYKPAIDWFSRIFFTLIVMFSIDIMPNNAKLHYSFISFLSGIIISYILKRLEKS